ncbi:hypothetical protein [Sphaerisporangium corydalis]|uniref:Lipoprotein n=1 Tax=Sphaerisporangium corydalis TaxID=1441875 RepID=A0ABV9EMS5_9ACTN|nr:hypothetical protein [Sphaerisporangium corydalis]
MRNRSAGQDAGRRDGKWVRAAAAGLVVGALVSGCSQAPTQFTGRAGAPAAPKGPERPAFASDLGRVCGDGLGFPGLPAYRRASKTVHPAVLMGRSKDLWSQTSPSDGDFPRGWILGYADDVEQTQLVVCYERTGTAPAGKVCQMEDSKTHKPLSVTMYNTTYRVRVLEGRTGRALYAHKGRAASTTCPLLTYISQGSDPTKYYTEARPADYRKYIKRFIMA